MMLHGKRVVVLGGSSGVGFAVARLARDMSASVVIASSRKDSVDAALAKLDGVAGSTVNLRDEADVARFFGETGAFDHLVFTAGDWGAHLFASTADIDVDQAREGFEVRVFGALSAAKHASRTISKDGSITLTSGMISHRPMKGAPVGSAVSGATEQLARALAVDLAPVRVNDVCLGVIMTDHTKTMRQDMLSRYIDPLPIPRGGTPEEAAMAFIYLMLNTYATGQILPVEGGGLLV